MHPQVVILGTGPHDGEAQARVPWCQQGNRTQQRGDPPARRWVIDAGDELIAAIGADRGQGQRTYLLDGLDRHANVGSGKIDPELLASVVRDAGAPVVFETPGGADEHRADFEEVRSRL